MTTPIASSRLSRFQPAALVLAGVLAGTVFAEHLRPAPALAQDKSLAPDKVLNSAEIQRQMANSLSQVNDRLKSIESILNGGLKVKVTEMPASKEK